MLVNDEEKKIVAGAIELKRRCVRLRREVDRAWQSSPTARTRPRMDGKPVNPDSLPAGVREKYLLYTQALEELRQLRASLRPEVRSLVDPQLSC